MRLARTGRPLSAISSTMLRQARLSMSVMSAMLPCWQHFLAEPLRYQLDRSLRRAVFLGGVALDPLLENALEREGRQLGIGDRWISSGLHEITSGDPRIVSFLHAHRR